MASKWRLLNNSRHSDLIGRQILFQDLPKIYFYNSYIVKSIISVLRWLLFVAPNDLYKANSKTFDL